MLSTMTEQQVMAALHWPGWVAIGEPDVSAQIAERGADYETASSSGPVDEWDWQRYVPVIQIDGTVKVFENAPTGAMAQPVTIRNR